MRAQSDEAAATVLLRSRLLGGARRLMRRWRGELIAAGLIATATGIGGLWTLIPDPRNLSLVFFAAILVSGMWLGARPALVAALMAFGSYNYFLIEPYFSFRVAAADILALTSFLAGGLLVARLSGRLRDRAQVATDRLRSLMMLFEASRDLSEAVAPRDAALRVVKHLRQGGLLSAIWVGEGAQAELMAVATGAERRAAECQKELPTLLVPGLREEVRGERRFLSLETRERALGGVAIWPADDHGIGDMDRRWVGAILELGAVAIDRARLVNEVAAASVVAEREGLRTALLSSLSHDLRTPISTILASATSLQEHGARFDAQTEREMLETIQEQSERLNRYITNLLEMTRLESGALVVKSVLIDPNEAMASALQRLSPQRGCHRIVRDFKVTGERVLADPVLLEQAIVNLLENAAAYSPPGAALLVQTQLLEGRIVMSVADQGPGIPPGDLDHVFEKFFRGRSDRRPVAGVGLGLSVSRGLVEAFGGSINAKSPVEAGKGTRMEIWLPAHPALESIE